MKAYRPNLPRIARVALIVFTMLALSSLAGYCIGQREQTLARDLGGGLL